MKTLISILIDPGELARLKKQRRTFKKIVLYVWKKKKQVQKHTTLHIHPSNLTCFILWHNNLAVIGIVSYAM